MLAVLSLCLSIATQLDGEAYLEPDTEIAFATELVLGDETLRLTGADRRRALGKNAYAVGHYCAAETADMNPKELLAYYLDCDQPKAVVLIGSYSKVPARGIRWAWKRGLSNAGYDDKETLNDFVDSFDDAFMEGDTLIFDATDPDHLYVTLNGEAFGDWEDADLIRAIWAICLGPDADVVERENMVALLTAD